MKACSVIGLDSRTLQRWRAKGVRDDLRNGPKTVPANKISDDEREKILKTVNAEEFRDLSPNQIVPLLADQGKYIGSESTIYRVLREDGQQKHRETSREPRSKPKEHIATGPNQVWSWDITYLPSLLRGKYFYLYLILDVWSRKIVAWNIHDSESMDYASKLITFGAAEEGIDENQVVLHSDNGSPMKGATMLATLTALGIVASFSRPSVSNDNPFSESLFRTLKYRPEYPKKPFETIEDAIAWVSAFVEWYNKEHLHSNICFVTPEQKHRGEEIEILKQRRRVYEAARKRNPERWSGNIRKWDPVEVTALNPDVTSTKKKEKAA